MLHASWHSEVIVACILASKRAIDRVLGPKRTHRCTFWYPRRHLTQHFDTQRLLLCAVWHLEVTFSCILASKRAVHCVLGPKRAHQCVFFPALRALRCTFWHPRGPFIGFLTSERTLNPTFWHPDVTFGFQEGNLLCFWSQEVIVACILAPKETLENPCIVQDRGNIWLADKF